MFLVWWLLRDGCCALRGVVCGCVLYRCSLLFAVVCWWSLLFVVDGCLLFNVRLLLLLFVVVCCWLLPVCCVSLLFVCCMLYVAC